MQTTCRPAFPARLWRSGTIGQCLLPALPPTVSSHKLIALLPLALLSARPLVGHLYADPFYAPNQSDQRTLQVSVKKEELVGGTNERQVERVYLTSGTNQFAFAVPEGFRVDASNPQKIVLTDSSCSCFITFRFVTSSRAESVSASSSREMVLSRFPGAKISQESVDY